MIFLRFFWALASGRQIQNGFVSQLCIHHSSISEISPFLSSMEYVIRVAVFCTFHMELVIIKHSNDFGLAWWTIVILKRCRYARFFEKCCYLSQLRGLLEPIQIQPPVDHDYALM